MNNSRFRFKQGDLETIVEVLSKFPEIKKAVIFVQGQKETINRAAMLILLVGLKIT
jgi:hypothetical protein